MNMKKVSNRANVFALILFAALGCFLLFNYSTTYETLESMLGKGTNVLLFAIAVSLVDFAGLARILTPEVDIKKESFFTWVMLIVWFIAALCDIILTWWWVALQMSKVNIGAALPPGVGTWMIEVFPWAVAFMEFAIRVPLVLLVGQYIDVWLGKLGTKRTSFGNNRPKTLIPPGLTPVPAKKVELK